MRPPTERDMETLNELVFAYDQFTRDGPGGVAPIEFGGQNGSHHSATAAKLVRLGLVETRKRGYPWGKELARWYRGSNVYRPTEAGRAALAKWKERP